MLLSVRDNSLVIHTPAKVNLFLEVLGKRSDGYHELQTLMVAVGIYDSLHFTDDQTSEISLSCHGMTNTAQGEASLPVDGRNLVVRAARSLAEYTGISRGVRIDLCKRIPLEAGLGGGSSDAAATLVALNRLWDLRLSGAELCQVASQVGSDVPFFVLSTPTAMCTGRGEVIKPISHRLPGHVVIVKPQSGLSAAEVYRHCQPAAQQASTALLMRGLEHGRQDWIGRSLFNRLQQPAEELRPSLERINTFLSQQSLDGFLMSGSGTSYFGLCAHRRQARRIAARLRASGLGKVFVTRSAI